MSFPRASTAVSSFTRKAAFSIRPLSTTPSRFAQGYGHGNGDPKGEDPQSQGGSNKTKHNAEHPGPEPSSVGQGTGAGPTKAGGTKAPREASEQSRDSGSKDSKETGSNLTGGSVGGGHNEGPNGAKPKIHDRSTPAAADEKESEVEQHNKEFEQRYDRAPPAQEDKVDKKFWSGQGGGDSQS